MIKLKYGDLVVVSHWRDFDFPNDAVQLGRFSHCEDGYFYVQHSRRGYKYCRRVEKKTRCAAEETEGR